MAFWCTVCGKATSVASTEGSMKHPICKNCFNDVKKKQKWFKQLKEQHPELLELYYGDGQNEQSGWQKNAGKN